jgi:6-phosphogluconolactonase
MADAPLVTRVPDADAAAERAADVLATAIDAARTIHGAAHVAVAGGSTPKRAYQLLGPRLGDWRDVHLWFGDERVVPDDSPDSTLRLLRESLDAPGATIHRVATELGAEGAAEAYARELGDTTLDVVLLGMGEDGHTASLFPGHPQLHAEGVVVPVHDSPKPPPDRVTLTLGKINDGRRLLLLVSGEGKANALRRVLAGPDDEVPASLLDRGKLEVVADDAALTGVDGGDG